MNHRHLFWLLPATALAALTINYRLHNPPPVSPPEEQTTPISKNVPSSPKNPSNAIIASQGGRCHSLGGLPDARCTPGAINPDINQANIGQNICNPSWSTKSIRPPVSYTNQLKQQGIKDYGYSGNDANMSASEEDHLISLEIGGSPTDPKNLWPEAYNPTPGAHEKDQVENRCHKQICANKITLIEAQKEISSDWRIACP